jgi:hypothetical protein
LITFDNIDLKMKKFHILLVLVILGFFLMPFLTYSCEMKSKKSCCNKEMSSSNDEKMDCCKNINDSKSKNKDHEGGCNGKCGHSNCVTTSTQFSVAFFEIRFNNNNFDFSVEKPKFYHSETFISAGFTSVWLPPKIK